MPTAQVSVFNANQLPLAVSVNNGQPFSVPAASFPSMTPQSQPQGGPSFGNTPGPNTLAPGTNNLSVTPQGSMQPIMFRVDMPGNVQWSSVQLYVFFDNGENVAWVLLESGRYVSSGSAAGR